MKTSCRWTFTYNVISDDAHGVLVTTPMIQHVSILQYIAKENKSVQAKSFSQNFYLKCLFSLIECSISFMLFFWIMIVECITSSCHLSLYVNLLCTCIKILTSKSVSVQAWKNMHNLQCHSKEGIEGMFRQQCYDLCSYVASKILICMHVTSYEESALNLKA